MSRERQKGTSFETAIVEWLKKNLSPYAHRNAQAGALDVGDVGGILDVVLELKNCARMELAGWVEEARREAANAEASVFAVVHKRKGRADPGEQYVTLPLWVFVVLLKHWLKRKEEV